MSYKSSVLLFIFFFLRFCLPPSLLLPELHFLWVSFRAGIAEHCRTNLGTENVLSVSLSHILLCHVGSFRAGVRLHCNVLYCGCRVVDEGNSSSVGKEKSYPVCPQLRTPQSLNELSSNMIMGSSAKVCMYIGIFIKMAGKDCMLLQDMGSFLHTFRGQLVKCLLDRKICEQKL